LRPIIWRIPTTVHGVRKHRTHGVSFQCSLVFT
jgi:hypothetical protein